jgi:hypothetical protein
MKQCSFINENHQRCDYPATVSVIKSSETKIERYNHPSNNDDWNTIQACKELESNNLCYYHEKLTKGLLYDSKHRSPGNVAQAREAERKAERQTRQNL